MVVSNDRRARRAAATRARPEGGRRAGTAGAGTEPGAVALVGALAPFGFAEYDARAYAALLVRQPATAYEVAKGAGIPDSKIYRVLEKLQERGVATRVRRDPATFAALPPASLVATLEAAAAGSLRTARAALCRVEAREAPVAAWPLERGAAVQERAAALVAVARTRVEIACGGAPLAALAGALARARERGVQVVLGPAGAGPDGAGREPCILVADRSEGLVARLGAAPDGRIEGRGLASREPSLVDALVELLERRRAEAEAASRATASQQAVRTPALEAAAAPGRLDIC